MHLRLACSVEHADVVEAQPGPPRTDHAPGVGRPDCHEPTVMATLYLDKRACATWAISERLRARSVAVADVPIETVAR